MITIKDILEENKDEKDSIYIHLHKAKIDKFDPLIKILWEGWLKDIPDTYMDCEVIGTGQSLADNEKGINGFYIEITDAVKNQLKLGEITLRFNSITKFQQIKAHMEMCHESELNNEFVAAQLIELGMRFYKFL